MTEDHFSFATHNGNGTPKTCKFCRKPVWWHKDENRWYDPGGEKYHVDSCPRRKKHFHDRAMDAAETRRQKANA